METKTPHIAGAGICCVDYIVAAPQVRWGDMALVSDYIVQGGGLVGTAMVACARLGAKCDLLTLLGDDTSGDEIAAELVAEGIPADGILRIRGAKSPFSFIHVDEVTGDRTIFHRSGAGLALPEDCRLTESAAGWDALLVDDIYLDLAILAAAAARERGIPVVADLIPDDRNAELVRLVDILIAPRHYARQLGFADNLGAALDTIHKLGPTTAVITLGADGWVYSDAAGRGSGDAFKVDVVDTTGAGDTFHGAFTYAVGCGWDTAKAAEFASAVAAIKCTKAGGRTGLPSLAQVSDFIHRNRTR